ncbi:hypothetical protein T02_14622, partial [Trichinella nativa]
LPIILRIRILFFFLHFNMCSVVSVGVIQCNICIHRVRSTVDTCTAIPVHHMDLILLESSGEVDWSID